MKQRITAIFLLACLTLTLLAGCNSKALSDEDAKKIAMEHMGVTAEQVSNVDVHMTTHEGAACYSVYITIGTEQMEYVIHGKTGEILHYGEGNHSHSH
jgi:hypothetical protein